MDERQADGRQVGRARRSDPVARDWARALAPYRQARPARGLVELTITAVPFVALWAVMWFLVDDAYWLSLLLAVPAAGLLVRLFMIQHDCGHGSFFGRRWANDGLGRVLSVVTLTPYDHWRTKHAVHHSTAGNLDRQGIGDVLTLSVREFQSRGWWGQLGYRVIRSPWIILLVAPVYLFLLRYRLPGELGDPWTAWASTMATNAAIVGAVVLLMASLGAIDFLLVQAPIALLAASASVWLFYAQHQFEHSSWEREGEWTFHAGALHGSSHVDLPPLLRWFTANIGVHHVHHLCSRIPSYRLGEVLRDHPELRAINRLTLRQSLACLRLALWDEDRRTMVSFREARLAERVARAAGGAASTAAA